MIHENIISKYFSADRDRERDHSRDRSHRSDRGGYRSGGPFTIKMGGLPYKATVNEIIDWFHPRANCVDVRILRGRDNRWEICVNEICIDFIYIDLDYH